ncbi:MAG: four helix bundle protein [Thermoanaerobaculia bacterium]
MSTYRDLLVWQKCRVLTKEIYTVTGSFPRSEVFGLSAQMRRAATSIMCNIAEGQGRRSARDQVHFYYMARGSLLELETQLFVSVDLGYVDDKTIQQRLRQTEEIGRMLNGLIRRIRDRNRESEARGPRPEA